MMKKEFEEAKLYVEQLQILDIITVSDDVGKYEPDPDVNDGFDFGI